MGGWVGGWVDEKVEEEQAVRMSYCTPQLGGWVGGWDLGKGDMISGCSVMKAGLMMSSCRGGWVGGWVGSGGWNELLYVPGGWVGGWVGGTWKLLDSMGGWVGGRRRRRRKRRPLSEFKFLHKLQ